MPSGHRRLASGGPLQALLRQPRDGRALSHQHHVARHPLLVLGLALDADHVAQLLVVLAVLALAQVDEVVVPLLRYLLHVPARPAQLPRQLPRLVGLVVLLADELVEAEEHLNASVAEGHGHQRLSALAHKALDGEKELVALLARRLRLKEGDHRLEARYQLVPTVRRVDALLAQQAQVHLLHRLPRHLHQVLCGEQLVLVALESCAEVGGEAVEDLVVLLHGVEASAVLCAHVAEHGPEVGGAVLEVGSDRGHEHCLVAVGNDCELALWVEREIGHHHLRDRFFCTLFEANAHVREIQLLRHRERLGVHEHELQRIVV
mmetsp:Transcript_16944/g.66095  ORF Transcript_16944/g.66095 Transcript_16944/m.66095 type:complete len:319 (-) Transcript_16944:1405-2361(-)